MRWPSRLPQSPPEPSPPARWRQVLVHGGLLLLTFLTTTVAGAEWIHQRLFFAGGPQGAFRLTGWLTPAQLADGLWFSVPFLAVLTIHEMGHFLMARHYGIRTSWPYYLPFYLGVGPSIGTMGAVIRIRDRVFSRREYFDIGVAGPLAGFVALLPVLLGAFLTLPHLLPAPPPVGLQLGHNLLLVGLEKLFDIPTFAHASLTRQPLVLAGYLGTFFTALNLIPVGQLDGGHLFYGLFGYARAARLSAIAFTGLVFYAGLGVLAPTDSTEYLAWGTPIYLGLLYVLARPALPTAWMAAVAATLMLAVQVAIAWQFPHVRGNAGGLLLALLLARGVGLFHPIAPDDGPLDRKRQVIGWLTVAVLVLCFAPSPFE